MIRATAVLSLTVLLILVFYIPAQHPPEDFVAQIRVEHAAAKAFWGPEAATRMLDRAVRMQDATAEVTPTPRASDGASIHGVNNAVAQEMASVNQRLFNNPYFRSVDALLLLGSYRLATLLEWLIWIAVFTFASMADGLLHRLVKASEFLRHDPEKFALYVSTAIIGICGTTMALFIPVYLPSLILPCMPLAVSVILGKALGHIRR